MGILPHDQFQLINTTSFAWGESKPARLETNVEVEAQKSISTLSIELNESASSTIDIRSRVALGITFMVLEQFVDVESSVCVLCPNGNRHRHEIQNVIGCLASEINSRGIKMT